MPTLKRLAELQKHLRKLGGEQETVGKWGEQPYIKELPPPSAIDEGKPSALDANRFTLSAQSAEAAETGEPAKEQEPSLEALLDAPSPDEDYASFLKSMNLDTLSAPAETAEGLDDDLAKLLEPESSFETEESVPVIGSEFESGAGSKFEIPAGIDIEPSGTEPEFFDADTVPEQATSEILQETTPGTEMEETTPGTETDAGMETGIDSSEFQPEMPEISNFPEESEISAQSQESADVLAAPDLVSETFGAESSLDIATPGTDSGFDLTTPGTEQGTDQGIDLSKLGETASADTVQSSEEAAGFDTAAGASETEITSGLADIADLPSMDDIHDLESLSFGNEIQSSETPAEAQEAQSAGSESIEVPEIGTEAFHAPDELDQELASLEKGTLEPENFSIDSNWDDSFTIPGFEPKKPEKPASSAFVAPPEVPKPADDRPVTIELTENQVDELQETLLSYPLNVRLCIEDIIANNHGTMTHQKELIQMLVDGASAYDAAKLASKILRRPVEVPRGYDKRRGAAFEEERNSFRYIFIHSILPVLQIIVLAAIGLGILGFIGYNFIYRPIHAQILYSRGYNQIIKDKYPESLQFFIDATNEWRMKPWFYKYAEKYIEKRQYGLAEKIYWTLLSDDYWPKDIKGTLDYARMKSELQYDFAHAEKEVMERIVKWNYFHKDALLFLVRNYLNWAYYLEQQYKPPSSAEIASIYNKARLQLATLMEKYGKIDQYLELMLLYLIRSERVTGKDNVKEIAPYAKYYLGNKKSKFSASTLAELAEYLMEHEILDQVQDILTKAVKNEPYVPEAHSAIARWFRKSMLYDKELNALENSVFTFEKADAARGLDNRQTKRYLLDLIRLSELYLKGDRNLDAMEKLERCIKRYEQSLEELRFPKSAEFGKAYALLGDVYFYKPENFDTAIALYEKAEDSGYVTPEMDYHRGYIYYRKETLDDYKTALSYFYRASLNSKPTPYLLMALGNTLYKRGDYFAAQSYYKALVDRLQTELDLIPNPNPQQRPSHDEIVRLLVAARNNLGAAYLRVANVMGDSSKRADAMAQFTESARLFDSLTRDQKTMIRSDAKNYGFLNLDFVLHPKRDIDIILDKNIMADMKFPQ